MLCCNCVVVDARLTDLKWQIHYTADLYFAISWGAITGFNSPFPWFYPLFFCCMIIHRAYRDVQRCRLKYGAAWEEYEKRVPYLFIPVGRLLPLPQAYERESSC